MLGSQASGRAGPSQMIRMVVGKDCGPEMRGLVLPGF